MLPKLSLAVWGAVVAFTALAFGQEAGPIKFKLSAFDLPDVDGLGEGITDPYAIIFNENGENFGQTEIILESQFPQWETIFNLTYDGSATQIFYFEVYDDDHGVTADDFLGGISINIQSLLNGEINGGFLVGGTTGGSLFINVISESLLPVLPRKLMEFEVHHAAFVEAVADQGDESTPLIDRYSIFVSSFNPLTPGGDPKYYIRSPGHHLYNSSALPVVELDNTAFWPNNADPMPASVAGVTGIVWTSGFLVPGKKKGMLELYDTSVTPPVGPKNIAVGDAQDFSYHRVLWKDIDGDGDLDALTARFHVSVLGATSSEFLWLENPGELFEDTPSAGWAQHSLLSGGPDVHFRNAILPANGMDIDVIVAAEFWNEKLVLYYTETGDWRDPIKQVDIDTTLGQTFDLYVYDFNLDGKLDIVVTAYNKTLGNVFAYEAPEDFRTQPFVKHTMADGFKANPIIGGQSMTPGGLTPFYPYEEYKVDPENNPRKPYVMLSGDDDGRHYILEPVSNDPSIWLYTKHVLVDTGATTSGKFAVVDFDNDGYMEIVAAGYSANTLYVYTYKPEE